MAANELMVLTTAGQALYAKVQTGTALKFTRMQVGSGQLSTTLTTALTSGMSYSSLAVAALPRAIANGDTVVIGSGSTSQTVTVSSAASASATTVDVVAFTANANYTTGTLVTDITDAASLTALITPIAYFNIASETTSGSTANIRGIFENTNLTSSTYVCEVGLFADDASGTEILYAYGNAGSLGDTFPPYSNGPFSRQYQISSAVGNATSVTANVPSTVYVATSEVGAANGVASLDANGDVPASQLGNVPSPADASTTAAGIVETSVAPSGTPVAVITDDPAYKAVNGGTYVTAGTGITTQAGTNKETVSLDTATTALTEYLLLNASATQTVANGVKISSVEVVANQVNSIGTNNLGLNYGNSSQPVVVWSDLQVKGSSATFSGSITSSSGQLGSASGTWTPASGSLNVAAGTVINIASVPSGAKMFFAGAEGGWKMWGATTPNGSSWEAGANGGSGDSGYASGISSTSAINPVTYYDGSYHNTGYFQVNGAYLQLVITGSPTSDTTTTNPISWGVS